MDTKKIKVLAEILNNFELSSIEITEGENKIVLKKEQNIINIPMQQQQQPKTEVALTSNSDSLHQISNKTDNVVDTIYNYSEINEIKSPLVGTFYDASSPDSKPYAEIGAKVKKGDTLCIVEAMKLMNEITAEYDCEIVDVCVGNGEIIEYGQILFKVI